MIARLTFLLLLISPLSLYAQQQLTLGKPTFESVEHGKYWRYVPRSVKPESNVLVIAHGIFGKQDTARDAARTFLKVWTDFSDDTGTVLVAPVFDNQNFGCTEGCPPGWGYRGLYGREVGADDFLHEMIDELKKINSEYDGKFYLFGHSAGGQFVSHYVVKHPSRVHTAAISAPAWLPFPTMEDNWPRGMKPRHSVRRWPGESEDQDMLVVPDPEAFLAAAELPLLVTSGALDLDPLRPGPSQGGDTHVARAEAWAKAMNAYAAENNREGNITRVIVPEVGHGGGTMARSTMPFLKRHMSQNRASLDK